MVTERLNFDEGCGPLMFMTIRRGPTAGRTLVYCTCDWSHIYKSRHKAEKRGAEHVALGNRVAA
jgi:hypothetical protein